MKIQMFGALAALLGATLVTAQAPPGRAFRRPRIPATSR